MRTRRGLGPPEPDHEWTTDRPYRRDELRSMLKIWAFIRLTSRTLSTKPTGGLASTEAEDQLSRASLYGDEP